TDTEILTWLDDHSRYALSVTAWHQVTGPIVLAAFRAAVQSYGPPAATLTDNGMVFTTRFSGGKGGRNGLENELRRLGVNQKNGRPNHPPLTGQSLDHPAVTLPDVTGKLAGCLVSGSACRLDWGGSDPATGVSCLVRGLCGCGEAGNAGGS